MKTITHHTKGIVIKLLTLKHKKQRTNTITYGHHHLQAMDCFPANTNKQWAVLFIHGGGWCSGHKEIWWPYCGRMKAQGFCSYTMNYRLAPEFSMPDMLSDVVTAYNTIKQHHTHILLCGDSAGGHLAARTRGIFPTARILFGAPLVFDRYDPKILNRFKGKADRLGTFDFDVRAECTDRYVAQAFKNTFILHGSDDKIVPGRHADAFYAFLKQHGTENISLCIFPHQPHEFQFRKMKNAMIDHVVDIAEGLRCNT